MTVYFYNKEPIDLATITTMGVSVKVGDNPVGFFGTGLKYSIATWLRHGCGVVLIRDGERIVFSARPESIRGQEFHRVYMGETPLGFTTDLGKTWEPWQAYRELACNAMDEDGHVSDKMPEGVWGTIFIVHGGPADEAYRNRHETFIATKPIVETTNCDIHAGVSKVGYYRGVRAHSHDGYSLFTYNVKSQMNLTEDRTIKEPYWYRYAAREAVLHCDDEDIIHQAVMAEQGAFERSFDYDNGYKPSDAFLRVVRRLRSNAHLNASALKAWMRHAGVDDVYTPVDLDGFEESVLDDAFVLLRRMGCRIERDDFMVVDSLGEGCLGTVRNDQIIVSRRVFDMGSRYVASTLYEEWLHANEGFADESRDLQNFLFDKLFAMIERVVVMESNGPVRVAA